MSSIFDRCSSLSTLPDISKWNTNNALYMGGMFYGCSSLSSLPDISKLNIKNFDISCMDCIFDECYNLIISERIKRKLNFINY